MRARALSGWRVKVEGIQSSKGLLRRAVRRAFGNGIREKFPSAVGLSRRVESKSAMRLRHPWDLSGTRAEFGGASLPVTYKHR